MQRRAAHTDARIADNAVQLSVMGNGIVHQFFDGGGAAAGNFRYPQRGA